MSAKREHACRADTVVYSRRVFDVYLGLTASGYHLANPIRAGLLIQAVLTGNWPKTALDYFREARIDDGRVNPYWPRGSILAAVAWLTECGDLDPDLSSICAYLATLRNVSPAERGCDVAKWALALPDHILSLESCSEYGNALSAYALSVEQEISSNGLDYCRKVRHAVSKLARLFPGPPQSVLTVLNPLQADELTDVIHTDRSACIVTSRLRPESYLHELIELHLEAVLPEWRPAIARRRRLLDAVYESMNQLSYAWDRTDTSWVNVFCETLTRSLAAWVLAGHSPPQLEEQVGQIVGGGFIYARPIVEAIAGGASVHPLTVEWLERCLDACDAVGRAEA